MPSFLITNDDGIQIYFLRSLAAALLEFGEGYVAAPKNEQSWVGRAMSRNRDIAVRKLEDYPATEAWEIDGTPSDAINIALGHLMPHKPDVVVSGINVGWNAMVPVLYSSGTVAGALEGASWGIPAVALSMYIHEDHFEKIKKDSVNPDESVRNGIDIAAQLGAEFSNTKVGEANEDSEVYNVNFPMSPKLDSPWIATQPGKIHFKSLFQRYDDTSFRFAYEERMPGSEARELPSDYETFLNGNISLSVLNFNQLGKRFSLEKKASPPIDKATWPHRAFHE